MEEFEFELDDLLNTMCDNVKEDIKTFDDLMALDSNLRRELYIGDINCGIGASVDSAIRFWNNYDNDHGIPTEDRQPIKLYIDSAGGSLTDSFTIINAIKLSKTPVWTINTGCAYSGGFFILISGHHRIGYPNSSYLFHEGSAQNGGTSSQFENFTSFYKKQLKQLEEHTLENTTISKEKYDEIHKEDIWFTSEEALENGIIDKIATELV